MPSQDLQLQQLTALVEHLTANLQRGERRALALERTVRWGVLLVVTLLGTVFYMGSNQFPRAMAAQTDGSVLADAEQAVVTDVRKADQELNHAEQADIRNFDQRMEAVKQKLANSDQVDPALAVAAILNDMKKALQAMPKMAKDMHAMRADMHQMAANMQSMDHKMGAMPDMAVQMAQMNLKMGIMAYGVDSTMGRMGRMIPWAPW